MNDEKETGHPDAENEDSTRNTYFEENGQGRHQPRKSRTRVIIIGVVIAVVVIAVVVVVAVVVTQNNKSDQSGDDKPTCGPYSYPGINISDLRPMVLSRTWTCPLEGDCWTGEQCYECFKLDTWKVGNINDIPVCCPQCLISGLIISNSKCECRGLKQN